MTPEAKLRELGLELPPAPKQGQKGFLFGSLLRASDRLQRYTLFERLVRLRYRGKPRYPAAVEVYVLCWLALGVLCLSLIPYCQQSVVAVVVVSLLAGVRVLEILHYLVHVSFFVQTDPKYSEQDRCLYKVERTVILHCINYAEILVWFASLYVGLAGWFSSKSLDLTRPLTALYFSAVTMTTLGYGDIRPVHPVGAVMVTLQALIGVFMAILIFARFVGAMPRFRTLGES